MLNKYQDIFLVVPLATILPGGREGAYSGGPERWGSVVVDRSMGHGHGNIGFDGG